MKNVGDSGPRNDEFEKRFSRDRIIQSCVKNEKPIIFDIGAHHGQSIKYLEGIFKSPVIYSFEPDPESFKILSKNSSKNNKIFNFAFSNVTGQSSFFQNDISHTNGLYEVNVDSNDSIRAQDNSIIFSKEVNSKINVDTYTLDKFFEDYNIDSVDLMKVDTQGAEEMVLEGGVASLDKINALILEVSFFDYYKHKTSFIDVEKYLLPSGFELFSILEISNNPMNGRTDWVEVLYKKI